jgi:hypothetical protein
MTTDTLIPSSAEDPSRTPVPRTAGSTITVAGQLILVAHGIVGLLWAAVILTAHNLRDCGLWAATCDGVTAGEGATEALVWILGGATWAAITAFVFTSGGRGRMYWALLLSPAWFLLAGYMGAAALLA